MQGTKRLFGPQIAFSKASIDLNRPQWRTISRKWQRYLSQQSHRPSLPKTSYSQPRRYASSDAAAPSNRIRNSIYGTGLVLFLAFGYYYVTDTRASIHQYIAVPALRILHTDPEEAHHEGVRYIKALYDFNLHPRERSKADQEVGDLQIEVFGHVLNNPVGTSAGIDKDGLIPSPLFALGPAIVEVGGTTPHPQVGNPKPRVFRLPSQNALINRYGLNSEGAEYVAMQLRERVRQYAYNNGLGLEAESERQVLDGEAGVPPGSLMPGRLLAVQVAKNKATPDNDIEAIARDYVYCVDHLAKYADILVVNVSSPNTPGLRDLQATAPLTAILTAVVDAAQSCNRRTKPVVMVKVSPDEDSDAQIEGICTAVWASGVDGVIVGNTTKKRPDTYPKGYVMPAKEERLLTETGGYSGPQLFERTVDLVGRYRRRLDRVPPQDDAPAKESGGERQEDTAARGTTTAERQPTLATGPTDPSATSSDASTKRDEQRLKPLTPEADQASEQPLLKLPERHKDEIPPASAARAATSASAAPAAQEAQSSQISIPSSPTPKLSGPEPKVIFATGGITTGEQCLQVLNAGASVCQIYTAMMYGGVGTVTRMKREMREGMKASSR